MKKIKPNLLYIGVLVGILVLSIATGSIKLGLILLASILIIGWLIKSINQTSKHISQKKNKINWNKK